MDESVSVSDRLTDFGHGQGLGLLNGSAPLDTNVTHPSANSFGTSTVGNNSESPRSWTTGTGSTSLPRGNGDLRELYASGRDSSQSSSSYTNSGDSWFIRPVAKTMDHASFGVDMNNNNASPRHYSGSVADEANTQEVFRAQRLAQQRRMMEEKVAHHLQGFRQESQEDMRVTGNMSPRYGQESRGHHPAELYGHAAPNSHHYMANHRPPHPHPHTHHSPALPPQHNVPLPAVNNSNNISGGSGNRMIYQVQFKRLVRFYTLGSATNTHGNNTSNNAMDGSSSSSSASTPALSTTAVGDFVIVGADRGEDMGIVTAVLSMQDFIDRRLIMSAKSNIQEEDAVIGTILRIASLAERQQLPKKYRNEEAVVKAARDLAQNTYHLPLTIQDADYQFDGHKLTIFYASDARVDFRDYVRDLFALFKTRIWMKKDPQSMMQRASNAETAASGYSLLGYVFDDNAAMALMTGMQIAMDTITQSAPSLRHNNNNHNHNGNNVNNNNHHHNNINLGSNSYHTNHHAHNPALPPLPPQHHQNNNNHHQNQIPYNHNHHNHRSQHTLPPYNTNNYNNGNSNYNNMSRRNSYGNTAPGHSSHVNNNTAVHDSLANSYYAGHSNHNYAAHIGPATAGSYPHFNNAAAQDAHFLHHSSGSSGNFASADQFSANFDKLHLNIVGHNNHDVNKKDNHDTSSIINSKDDTIRQKCNEEEASSLLLSSVLQSTADEV